MAFRELKPERAAAGSSLRAVNASVQSAWAAQRRKRIKDSLWWALPIIVVSGVVGSAMTRHAYFGVGFAVLVALVLVDLAYTKPGHVSLAGRRASGEAATALLAQVLPQAVDHLTPDGQVPADGQGGGFNLGMLEGLAGKLLG